MIALLAGVLGAFAAPDPVALDAEVEARFGQGDIEGALELARQSVAIRESTADPELPRSLNNLAALLAMMARFDEARPHYARALALWEASLGPDNPRVASVRSNYGAMLSEMGAYDDARAELERALAAREAALGPEHPKVADTLENLSHVLLAQDRLDEAAAVLDRCLALREDADPEDLARTLDARADLADRRGDLATARTLAERALALRRDALGPDHQHVALSHLHLGNLYLEHRRFDEALASLREAERIAAHVFGPDHPTVARARANQGWVWWTLGDTVRAGEHFGAALATLEASLGPTHPDVALVHQGLCRVASEQGDRQEALRHARIAVDIALSGQGHRELVPLLLDLADQVPDEEAEELLAQVAALLQGDPAATAYDRAHLAFRRARRIDDPDERGEAIRHAYDLFVAHYGEDHPQLVVLRALRARDLTPDLEAANQMAQEAVADLDDHFRLVHLDALIEAAMIARGLGETATARADLDRAIDLSWSFLATQLPWLSDREAGAVLARHRDALDAWLALNDTPLDGWRHVLAWKGMLTRSRLRARRQDPGAGELLADLATVREALSEAVLAADDPTHIANLRMSRELLERAVAQQTHVEVERPDPATVCASLPKGHVLVDLLRTRRPDGDRTLAFVVDSACLPERIDLGPALEIDRAVGAWRDAFGANDAGASLPTARVDARGERVAAWVWQPISDRVGDAPLWIVPDGLLAVMPWAALPTGPGRYLIEDHDLHILGSAAELSIPASPVADGGLLVVGDPDFGHGAPTSTDRASGPGRTDAPCRSTDWAALPGTADEASAVVDLWTRRQRGPVATLLGKEAEEDTVSASLPGRAVVHMATHGYLAPPACQEALGPEAAYNPMALSGLVLSGANAPDGRTDGVLTAEELSDVHLEGTQLVVLSACETGVGTELAGEGVLGLRSALTVAGARALLLTLRPIGDEATSQLMASFYDRLWRRRRPRDPASALREAQLHALARNRAAGDARPTEWGAFVVSGPGSR